MTVWQTHSSKKVNTKQKTLLPYMVQKKGKRRGGCSKNRQYHVCAGTCRKNCDMDCIDKQGLLLLQSTVKPRCCKLVTGLAAKSKSPRLRQSRHSQICRRHLRLHRTFRLHRLLGRTRRTWTFLVYGLDFCQRIDLKLNP